ncbi:hypothetical protein [Leptolyngbya sp. FACHB-261]|nr:hypothetical protein [Leptolyngbya sp. FACHB-261]
MENVDWQSVTAGGLAVAILLGGMLMMFSNVWTMDKKQPPK